MALTRWQHLTLIATPAQKVVWDISSRGLRVDVKKALEHKERLENEKRIAYLTIIEHPVVIPILADKSEPLERAREQAEASEAARRRYEEDQQRVRAARKTGDRSQTLKSLGARPRQVRVTRQLLALAEFNPGSSKQKAWLLYDRLKLPVQFNKGEDGKSHVTTDKKALKRLERLAGTAAAIKPVIAAFREYEHIDQLIGTFIEPAFSYEKVGDIPPTAGIGEVESVDRDVERAGPERASRKCSGQYVEGGGGGVGRACLSSMDSPQPSSSEHHTRPPTLVNLADIRIFTDIGLHRTSTGRLASGTDSAEKASESDINSQNQPKEISDIYIPEAGYYFCQVDWSKLEWLLTLYFARDIEGFARAVRGEDQHRRLAAVIYSCKYDEVSEEQRNFAKKGTHGINYGMGAARLADEAGISLGEAREIIRSFKAAFPIVARWRDSVVELARRQHYLQTPYGWRRWYWETGDDKAGEIYCFLPQATGADLCKICLPPMQVAVEKVGGWLFATTHDSIGAQFPEAYPKEDAKRLMLEVVEKPRKLLHNTIFPADAKVGYNWKEVR